MRWEHEVNDKCTQANGPLESGRQYHGYHDVDPGQEVWQGWDCFWIDLQNDRQISAELISHEENRLQLALFDKSCEPVGPAGYPCYAYAKPYEIGGAKCFALKGRNHVCIHTIQPVHSLKHYTLTVTFPSTREE